jgi:hypothetical protein
MNAFPVQVPMNKREMHFVTDWMTPKKPHKGWHKSKKKSEVGTSKASKIKINWTKKNPGKDEQN